MTNSKWINILIKIIWIMFLLIIGYLLLGSIFSTSYIGRLEYVVPNTGKIEINYEHTFFVKDRYWIHIVVFVLFSMLLARINVPNKIYIEIGYCVIVTILAIVIVILADSYPRSDQRCIMEIAKDFNNGDYSALDKGEYLFRFPFQYGIVCFYQICSLIFGSENYLAFQILNAFFIGFTYFFLLLILRKISCQFPDYMLILGVSFLFTPYLFFTTLVYGNIVGLLFTMASFFFLMKFDEHDKTRYMIVSCVTIVIATVLKANCQIFMIAEIIFLLFSIGYNLKNKKLVIKRALFIILIISGFALSKNVVSYQLTKLAGEQVRGCPIVTWVAMGMQDGKMAPGWWNCYVEEVYAANDYNYEETKKSAIDSIRKSINNFSDSITTMTGFYSKKVMSMWNNPLFQGLWIINGNQEEDSGLEFLMEGNGRYIYTETNNILQTWILVGAFLCCIFCYREISYRMILLPVSFIGGFIFHIFMEGKSTYAMPYYLLLIPLCVLGYQKWKMYLISSKEQLMSKLGKIGIAVIIVCLLSNTKIFVKLVARDDDTRIFNTYTQDTVKEQEESEK